MTEELKSFNDMVKIYDNNIHDAEILLEERINRKNEYLNGAIKILEQDINRYFPDAPKVGSYVIHKFNKVKCKVVDVSISTIFNEESYFSLWIEIQSDNFGGTVTIKWPSDAFVKEEDYKNDV